MKKSSWKIPQFSQTLIMKLGRAFQLPEAKGHKLDPIYNVYIYVYMYHTCKIYI